MVSKKNITDLAGGTDGIDRALREMITKDLSGSGSEIRKGPFTSEDEMKHVFQYITPKVAQKYLATSEGNRKTRKHAIDRIASDIRSGNWHITHQGIAFDRKGRLIDGHHRLMAIIEADRAVDMWVCYGVSELSKTEIDRNMVRTQSDTVKMQNRVFGYKNVKVSGPLLAVTRCLEFLPHSAEPPRPLSTAEGMRLFRKHSEAAAYSERIKIPNSNRGLRSAVARAWYHYHSSADSLARLDEFCEVARTGLPNTAGDDNAAVLLANWVNGRGKSKSDRAGVIDQYQRTQNAILCFMTRKRLRILKPVSDDLYPIEQTFPHLQFR